MKILEINAPDLMTAYYDPSADKVNTRLPSDTRKPILTLRHINRLKKIRAVKKLENFKRQDLLAIMYGVPDDGAGGAPQF